MQEEQGHSSDIFCFPKLVSPPTCFSWKAKRPGGRGVLFAQTKLRENGQAAGVSSRALENLGLFSPYGSSKHLFLPLLTG